MTHYANVCMTIGGLEYDLEVEFKVLSYGSSPSYDDPGEGPEIEIIAIREEETGRDLTKFCNEHRDWWNTYRPHYGMLRFHHGVSQPEKWEHGKGWVKLGPRAGYCHTEQGIPMLDDAIYEEICVNHMPDRDFDPYDY